MSRIRTRGAARIAAAAIVAAGCVVTPLAMAQASTAQSPGMTLIATNDTSALDIPCSSCVLQSDPPGAHIGGVELDAGRLRDTAGTVVGHFTIQSVGMTPFTADGPGELQLSAVLVIGHDQLFAQSLEEPPLNGGVAAVAGGTGHYRNAHGEIRYSDNADGSTTLIVDLN